MKKYLRAFISAMLLIGIDQWTKYLAVEHLKGTDGIVLLPNIFHLFYLENHGVAFGMFQNQIYFFLPFTMLITAIIMTLYYKTPYKKRYLPLRLCLILLSSGAIGNLIDRFRYGYVVDFFYFKLIDFPVFNVADCYVVIAVILFAFLFLFYYKEEELERDFSFFSNKSKKKEKN